MLDESLVQKSRLRLEDAGNDLDAGLSDGPDPAPETFGFGSIMAMTRASRRSG